MPRYTFYIENGRPARAEDAVEELPDDVAARQAAETIARDIFKHKTGVGPCIVVTNEAGAQVAAVPMIGKIT